jgi:hypothetical protein
LTHRPTTCWIWVAAPEWRREDAARNLDRMQKLGHATQADYAACGIPYHGSYGKID